MSNVEVVGDCLGWRPLDMQDSHFHMGSSSIYSGLMSTNRRVLEELPDLREGKDWRGEGRWRGGGEGVKAERTFSNARRAKMCCLSQFPRRLWMPLSSFRLSMALPKSSRMLAGSWTPFATRSLARPSSSETVEVSSPACRSSQPWTLRLARFEVP